MDKQTYMMNKEYQVSLLLNSMEKREIEQEDMHVPFAINMYYLDLNHFDNFRIMRFKKINVFS